MAIDRKFESIDRYVDRIARNVERELNKHYADTLRKLRIRIGELYSKYETGGALTYDEMQKYGRLQSFEREVNTELAKLATGKGNAIRSTLRRIYEESYYRAAWAIESEARAFLNYSTVRPEVVTRAIQNPISGLTLNDRLAVHRREIITRMRQEITQGLVRGSSYRDMADRIKGSLEGDLVKAMRVVRTEVHRVMEQGKHESLTHAFERGVQMKKRWISSRDERVRDSHADMDGQTVNFDEDFVNPETGGKGPAPGMLGVASDDINCRCLYIVEEIRLDSKLRVHDELSRMTYQEWLGERVA